MVARKAKVRAGSPAGVTLESPPQAKVCAGISRSFRANLPGGREAVSSSSCQLCSSTSFLGTERGVSHC